MKGLSFGRMCGDRSRYILEPRPHFQRQGECGGKFAHSCSHRLYAQHHMVVRPRNNAHKSIVGLQRQGAAVGAQRKGPTRTSPRFSRPASGDRPTLDRFGIGEGDGGNRCLVEGALLAPR